MNNGFTKTSVNVETPGNKLKKLRQAQNLTLEDVHLGTKIQLKHIQWLEEDNYKKLPPKVYVEGFLKSYAKFLRQDPEEIIFLFKKEQEIRENLDSKSAKFESLKTVKNNSLVVSSKTILTIFIYFSIASACFFVYRQSRSMLAPPKLEIFNPSEDTNLEFKELFVKGKTSEGCQVSINEQLVYTNESGGFEETINLHSGLNILKISSENRIGKKTEITRNIIYLEK
ncbi:MAG: helix-turn-helix domain-containing protein [bacterium]